MLKKEVILEGLDCANCAAKIEDEVNKLNGVKAYMNFMNKTLTLETESEQEYKNTLQQVETIVHKHEPDVVVKEKSVNKSNKKVLINEEEEEGVNKKEIIRLVVGGAIFVVGIIFNFQNWLELTLFIISYILVGGDVVLRAIKGIARGQVFSEHFLMSIATIGAFFVGEYPEGVAVMLFYLVGQLFQDMAVGHSRKSINALMDMRPDYANLKVGDEIKKVSPEEVNIGDIIIVKPGEKVPLDGKVIEGNSMVDTAALTGESVPRELQPGNDALLSLIHI